AKFNQRHDRVGHLFQDRYGSSRIWACEKLVAIAAYVIQNPVSAGLCASPADWRWGSAGARARGAPPWLASPRDAAGVYAALAEPAESAAA
ncbi:MAG: REP-associated tyrosine transposase, partial [Thermoleophilaceae bacterium]|nr:REP-associated tyrosine transposase [Thermoleophilaceae bacterium]